MHNDVIISLLLTRMYIMVMFKSKKILNQ